MPHALKLIVFLAAYRFFGGFPWLWSCSANSNPLHSKAKGNDAAVYGAQPNTCVC
jgi:hypothetical protein